MVEASPNHSLESTQGKYSELSKMAVISLLQPTILEDSMDDLALRGVFTKLNPKADLINEHARHVGSRGLMDVNPLEYDDPATEELYSLVIGTDGAEPIDVKRRRLLFTSFLVSGINLIDPDRVVTIHGQDESGSFYTKEAFAEAYRQNLEWTMGYCKGFRDDDVAILASELAVCMELF
jgi:hypothetical protein